MFHHAVRGVGMRGGSMAQKNLKTPALYLPVEQVRLSEKK